MKLLNPSERLKPRSRRLRKKLRVGEFTECGFSVDITFDKNVVQFNDAIDRLIEFVEFNHWLLGGGGDQKSNAVSGFICKFNTGTLILDDWLRMKNWLEVQTWIIEYTLHDLQDSWHCCDAKIKHNFEP